MKRIALAFCTLFIALSGFSQNDIISSFFDKFAGAEGITTVNITGDMLKLMAQAEMERRDTVIKSTLSEIRILSAEDESDIPDGFNLKAEIIDKLDKSVYKEMIRVNQTDEDVLVLVRESNGRIQELLVVVGGDDENALSQIKGDMLLSELADMAGRYQMKGFEHLKKMNR